MSVPGGFPASGGHQQPTGYPPGAGPAGGYPGGGWDQARSEQDTGPIPRVVGTGAGDPGQGGGFRRVDPAKLLGLIVAVLGALNFIWGFLPEITATRSKESLSVFAVGPAYVPVLLLIAGLLALAAFLPGSERSRLAVAAVSVGGAAGAIVSLGTAGSVELVSATTVGKGMGAILLVVFGIIQAVVAIGAYVIGADLSQVRGPRAAAGPPPVGPPPAGPVTPGPGWGVGAHPAAGNAWQAAAPAAAPGWYGPPAVSDAAGPPADESDTGPQAVVDPATARPIPADWQAALPSSAPAAPLPEKPAPAQTVASHGSGTPTENAPADSGQTVVLRSPAPGSGESNQDDQRTS